MSNSIHMYDKPICDEAFWQQKQKQKKWIETPVWIDSKMLVAHDEAKHNSRWSSFVRLLARSFWLGKHDTIKWSKIGRRKLLFHLITFSFSFTRIYSFAYFFTSLAVGLGILLFYHFILWLEKCASNERVLGKKKGAQKLLSKWLL